MTSDSRTYNFIERLKSIHGNKYDYTKIVYKNNKIPVEIICPTHGTWWATPSNLLKGCGCKICSTKEAWKSRNDRITTEIFIDRCNIMHDNKYDYSLVNYVNPSSIIIIICNIHGNFETTALNHLYNKSGCPDCGIMSGRLTKAAKGGTHPDDTESYKSYYNRVRKITESNYTKYKHIINPNNLKRSRTDYHLDHIYSIHAGFMNKIDPSIIGDVSNLRMLKAKDNLSKSSRCDRELTI